MLGEENDIKHKLSLLTHRDGVKRAYQIVCDESETIYSEAKKSGFRLPASCLNGVCHVCRAQLIKGAVLSGAAKNKVSRNEGEPSISDIMLCQAWPLEQGEIEIKNLYGPGELPVKKVKCQVLSVALLKGHVYQVDLQMPAGKLPDFFPGQYLALHMPEKEEASYFSIASRPGLRIISLHIQADPHLQSAVEVIAYLEMCLKQHLSLSLSLPYGEACLTSIPDKPLILIAAGTGFAQMKSIIEYLLEHKVSQPISLYWGVRKKEDLYHLNLAESWKETFTNFSFTPLIAEIEHIDKTDHHNQLSDAVLADEVNLAEAMVFVSGSPKLVFSAMDSLLDAGLPEERFFSDVLAYASREV